MPGLTPHLWVTDMQRSIAFYRDLLGFTVRRAEPPDSPTFASLERGEHSIMLSPYDESFGDWPMVAEAGKRKGAGGALSFYMKADDLDAEYARVQAAGATIVDPLADRPWGQAEFTIADPDGFWWGIWKVR